MKTKREQKLLCGVGTLAVCCMLTGCHMSHEWQEATCTTPKTCSVGGETEGEPLGHTWIEATCVEPKHCSVCGETEGEALEHAWVDATCAEPKHCSACGETDGEPLEHTLTEANYQQPATCEVCGETVGEPLQAEFEKYGLACNAELDIVYPYVIPCYDAGYTTNGKVTFTDYEIFESDETHEALDGYEWKAITVTVIFDDENAYYHGYSGIRCSSINYYNDTFFDNYKEENVSFTANYNGIEWDGIIYHTKNLQTGWNNDVFTHQVRYFYRVPKGYDGIVIVIYDPSIDRDSYNNTYELAKENDGTILFRLE
ncbi:MAG: hypothetical protein HDR24_11265 [Lachnospiraceae bacterium]|nr:hypothetical protein [Lachnospiraceae bacterium]